MPSPDRTKREVEQEPASLIPLDPTPRAILFDLDDTLCDYARAREMRLRAALSLDERGASMERPEPQLARMVAESIRIHPHGVDHFGDLLARYGITDPLVIESAARWYRDNRFHGLRLFNDATSVLRSVRTASLDGAGTAQRPVGIITNGPAEVQSAKVDMLGIRELIDFVIISEEFGAAKPDSRIFDEALRLAGVAAAEAVFIGDSAEFDMVGAIARGIPAIWVNTTEARWERQGRTPDRIVRSLSGIPLLVGSDIAQKE